ncbi:MAG: T9SS type A sorting domain-containing protein [Lewinellaceae bacterium]|nr:T9SS type A sorting domain-containing protein [Phaeodactylibacter sp.]MCB9038606.1 T9SS type A sorting domain-containing protein [Lewinellaceae bacterium]
MKKLFYGLVAFFILGFTANNQAQDFLNTIAREEGQPLKIQHLEAAFDNWAAGKDLSREKGWKWYARWLHEQTMRANGDGSFGNQEPLFLAAAEKVALEQNRVAGRSPGWMPAGPEDYADVGASYIIRGMGRINCIAFHPTDANTFWVGVAQGGIWKTTNGGQSWMPLDNGLPILRISDIAVNPNNPEEMYVSVGDYAYLGAGLDLDDRKRHTHYGMGVYKTTNGGQNWQATGLTFDQTGRDGSLTRRVFVHPDDGQRLVAAGLFGIRTSGDGGDTWANISDVMIWDIEQNPTNPNILYASTAWVRNLGAGTSGIWKSTDFGQSWTELNTGIPSTNVVQRIELAISPSNPDYVYALACDRSRGFYGLYRTTDSGENWELRSDSPNILHWYGGNSGGGQGTYDLTILVHPEDPGRIYTGGINIWGSEDGGLSWRIASFWVGGGGRQSIHADQHFLAYNPLDEKYYACNDGGVSRTDEIVLGSEDAAQDVDNYLFETQWEDIAGGMQITSFYRLGLSQSKPGDLIAGTQDNSSWLKKDGYWTGIIGGDGMECLIHPENPDILYGSSQYGNIVGSFDGGNDFFSVSGNIPSGNNERAAWTTPFLLEPGNPDVLYVAYTNLYKSENGGDSFQKLSDFPVPALPTSALAVSPADPAYIYLAHRLYFSLGQPSYFWRTRNGGASWDNVTAGLPDDLYFTYTIADDENPNLVWVTVGGFSEGAKVFRSEDGGDNWQNISYNLPNVPANCIVQDPNSLLNAVYVGTDIGVYYLNDEMSEWELYSEGLPNVVVSELEILASEGKLYAATFGRGIWEGNTVDETVGVNNPRFEVLAAQVSPNPNEGAFLLEVEGLPQAQEFFVEMVDITGRRVLQRRESAAGSRFADQYELELPYGLYFLRVTVGKERKVVKFIVE